MFRLSTVLMRVIKLKHTLPDGGNVATGKQNLSAIFFIFPPKDPVCLGLFIPDEERNSAETQWVFSVLFTVKLVVESLK